VERLVEEAIGRHMPDLARKQREQAADRRHFAVHHDQVSFEGTCLIDAELDLADALDLDAALGHIAAEFAALGNTLPLDQRRALAAGELARAQYSFFHDYNRAAPEVVEPELVSQRTPPRVPIETTEITEAAEPTEFTDIASTGATDTAGTLRDGDTDTHAGTNTVTDAGTGAGTVGVREATAANPDPGRFGRRDLVIYAHLSTDTLTGMAQTTDTNPEVDPEAVVTLEGHGAPLVTLGTLREWLHISGSVSVSIRPVIDLNANLTSRGRFAPPRIREQVGLRDRTCAAPYCTRPARYLDLDHLDPWTDHPVDHPGETDPPGGPPGSPPGEGGPPGDASTTSPASSRTGGSEPQTRSDNLAPLCRHHHRAKTLTDWCYEMLTPGVFLWTSPHGLRFLTFAGQTIDLN
jgi:hypothetical protein